TGTLSENRLRVAAIRAVDGRTESDVLRCAGLACPQPTPGRPAQHATDVAVIDALAGAVPDRDAELPFRPGRPFAAGIAAGRLAVKGAPEAVLAASSEQVPHRWVRELAA